MRCPKCGAKIPHGSPICFKCGTKMSQIQEASFQAVKQARAEYEHDKIVLTTHFPKDLSYTNTLLMCIFLGFFGGHYFYTKRYAIGIIYLVCSIFFITFLLIPGINTGFAPGTQLIYTDPVANFFFVLACIVGILLFFFWVTDIFRVATKRFKIPVVLKEN